ncbi:PI-actitoxin-Afv2b-like [Condylostylus longicornis]|uniref:PI-actitoxin-Afv2b-like n=1 Tax=Condylostylus longicornis TaxID=2530218 RepID=UPI00244E4AB8|nr:PI-actitoxin-Afv2b-like [Condylostylus longicornis]
MKFIFSLILLVLSILLITVNANPPEHCLKDYNPGAGRAGIFKFYYNSKKNECEPFLWGGIDDGGKENRFDTHEQCEAECKDK